MTMNMAQAIELKLISRRAGNSNLRVSGGWKYFFRVNSNHQAEMARMTSLPLDFDMRKFSYRHGMLLDK